MYIYVQADVADYTEKVLLWWRQSGQAFPPLGLLPLGWSSRSLRVQLPASVSSPSSSKCSASSRYYTTQSISINMYTYTVIYYFTAL